MFYLSYGGYFDAVNEIYLFCGVYVVIVNNDNDNLSSVTIYWINDQLDRKDENYSSSYFYHFE